MFDLRQIEDVLERNGGQRGAAVLREVVADLSDDAPLTRRELERILLPAVSRGELEPPLVNGWITLASGPIQLDFHWPNLRVNVEADGRRTDDTGPAFQRDRTRDRRLAAIGIQTLRFTRADARRPAQMVAELLAVAEQRRRLRKA